MNQKDILLLLLQNGKMTFQQLINEFSNRGSENRKRCDELLKQLTKNQLILKTPNNDVKGQMKWYSLTEKGLKACSIYIGDDLKQNYKNMKALRFAQSDPDKLRAYLLSGTKTATQEAIVNCRSEKEFIDRINSFVESIEKPLIESCWDLHDILCGPKMSDSGSFVTIIRGDRVHMYPTNLIQKTGLFNFLDVYILPKKEGFWTHRGQQGECTWYR